MPHTRFALPALVALATTLSACEGGNVEINGQEGVPLAELQTAGAAPTELVLASGDTVILTDGTTFDIKVEGADTESLRFVRDAEVIGVTRAKGWSGNSSATIRITMPPPGEIVIAGSGTVKAQSLASTAAINIGGAGEVSFATVAADKLDINIGGSGDITGAGTAKQMNIVVGGSGSIDLKGLKADTAEVSIGGAGDVAFASDGKVEANIAGSGNVTVTGSATCTVNAFGSGTLNCAQPAGAAPAAPAAPAKPAE